MIVEPFAHDKLEDNLNPIGRVFYGASTMLCTPASLSQEVGLGLGSASRRGAALEAFFSPRDSLGCGVLRKHLSTSS